MFRAICCVLVLSVTAACQGDPGAPKAGGQCTPTVAGGTPPSYADYEEARKAFMRRSADDILEATLEDAAWLRFEGDPATVEKAHRAYFEYGYTSFKIVLRVREFSQPTKETFMLEDSSGARVSGKPVSYAGSMKLTDGRWLYSFDLSFQHAVTRDTQWLKLTRNADGANVRWDFGGL